MAAAKKLWNIVNGTNHAMPVSGRKYDGLWRQDSCDTYASPLNVRTYAWIFDCNLCITNAKYTANKIFKNNINNYFIAHMQTKLC